MAMLFKIAFYYYVNSALKGNFTAGDLSRPLGGDDFFDCLVGEFFIVDQLKLLISCKCLFFFLKFFSYFNTIWAANSKTLDWGIPACVSWTKKNQKASKSPYYAKGKPQYMQLYFFFTAMIIFLPTSIIFTVSLFLTVPIFIIATFCLPFCYLFSSFALQKSLIIQHRIQISQFLTIFQCEIQCRLSQFLHLHTKMLSGVPCPKYIRSIHVENKSQETVVAVTQHSTGKTLQTLIAPHQKKDIEESVDNGSYSTVDDITTFKLHKQSHPENPLSQFTQANATHIEQRTYIIQPDFSILQTLKN